MKVELVGFRSRAIGVKPCCRHKWLASWRVDVQSFLTLQVGPLSEPNPTKPSSEHKPNTPVWIAKGCVSNAIANFTNYTLTLNSSASALTLIVALQIALRSSSEYRPPSLHGRSTFL